MPKENRKRGRREEKKRKRDEGDQDGADRSRRKTSQEAEAEADAVEIVIDAEGPRHDRPDKAYIQPDHAADPLEMPFYGMLDEQEQEYFKQADTMLDLNQFADADEKILFLENLYKEARGKELKMANSQSCSRLMERLIAASTPVQLKALWGKFRGHFLHLFPHRFASHCCEALFRKAALVVGHDPDASNEDDILEDQDSVMQISMEDLFLDCVRELEDNLGFLITDQFASHPLRVLLVVLSGMSLEAGDTTSLLQSKKKENVSSSDIKKSKSEPIASDRAVPSSFHAAVDTVIKGTTKNLDTSALRALATHPIANPVLQLLLSLSLIHSSNQDVIKNPTSLFRLLLPDDPLTEGTESAAFVSHLCYDPIGSRLVEVIVTYAPGKAFKSLFRSLFVGKLGTMARNETAAFVVVKILERLSTRDLEAAIQPICAEIENLVQRSRTSVIKTLIERCRVREVDQGLIVEAIEKAYGDVPADRLWKMLNLAPVQTEDPTMSAERKKQLDDRDPGKVHGSLLAQSMLETAGPLRDLITGSILALDMPALSAMAEDRTASRVLQLALTTREDNPRLQRQLIPQFYGHIADWAVHPVASHVVDALWDATQHLAFIREQIADELSRNETRLREALSGRAVWRNWQMDVYKTRRRDWLFLAKCGDGGSDARARSGVVEKKKTAIELARERHALKQTGGSARGNRGAGRGGALGVARGANAGAVRSRA